MGEKLTKRTEKYHSKQKRVGIPFLWISLVFVLGLLAGFLIHFFFPIVKNGTVKRDVIPISQDDPLKNRDLNTANERSKDKKILPSEVPSADISSRDTNTTSNAKDDNASALNDPINQQSKDMGEEPLHVVAGKLAVIIDDWGNNLPLANRFAALPIRFTAAVIPGLSYTSQTLDLLNRGNIPYLIHMPMQAISDKPGDKKKYRIGVEDSAESVEEAIQRVMPAFKGAIGLNNHRGSKATESRRVMSALMKSLADRNLIFLDSSTTPKTVAYQMAKQQGIPAFKNAQFLDNSSDHLEIMKQLSLAVSRAQKKGQHIAICHVRPATLRALHEFFVKKHGGRNVKLVTLDEMKGTM